MGDLRSCSGLQGGASELGEDLEDAIDFFGSGHAMGVRLESLVRIGRAGEESHPFRDGQIAQAVPDPRASILGQVRHGVDPVDAGPLADVRKVAGPVAGYTFRTALKQSASPCNGGFAGYAFTFPSLSVTPRLDACVSGFDNSTLEAKAYDIGGDVRLAHTWDLPIVSFDIGLSVGGWRQLGDKAKVVFDVGAITNADPTAARELGFFIVGLIYSFTDNLDLDLGIKTGVTDPEVDYAVLTGLAFRF